MVKQNTMNVVQEIFRTMLDETHANVLKTGYSMKEKYLIKNIKDCQILKNVKLTVEKTANGKSVIRWNSAIGETVAFPVTASTFYFSRVEKYKESWPRLNGKIDCDADKMKILDEEMQAIKYIFLKHSKDAGKHFR